MCNSLANCKLCNKAPSVSEYSTDGSGRTSKLATVECSCGNKIVKHSNDYEGYGKAGWEACESQWIQALRDAKSDWNILNTATEA